MTLAYASKQPLTGPGGLESWHPRDIATLADHLDEEMAATRRAVNGR